VAGALVGALGECVSPVDPTDAPRSLIYHGSDLVVGLARGLRGAERRLAVEAHALVRALERATARRSRMACCVAHRRCARLCGSTCDRRELASWLKSPLHLRVPRGCPRVNEARQHCVQLRVDHGVRRERICVLLVVLLLHTIVGVGSFWGGRARRRRLVVTVRLRLLRIRVLLGQRLRARRVAGAMRRGRRARLRMRRGRREGELELLVGDLSVKGTS